MKLSTGSGMKAIDHAAIHEFGMAGIVLMENAGRVVVDEMLKLSMTPSTALVLCGTGHNGGDGFVIARTLKNLGWSVDVAVLGSLKSLVGDPKWHFDILKKQNVRCLEISLEDSNAWNDLVTSMAGSDFLVDALLGTGLQGEVKPLHKKAIDLVNQQTHKTVVSVDIPSGIHSETGQMMGSAIQAAITVTFVMPKLGCVLYPGASHCGQLVVREIGIPVEAWSSGMPLSQWICDDDVKRVLPKRDANSHKGSFGKVCLIAGSQDMGGAALMAAEAILRSGTGLLRMFVVEQLKSLVLTSLPEAIVHVWDKESLDEITEISMLTDVTAVGSGCGKTTLLAETLDRLIANRKSPLVIDGDGLNVLAEANLLKQLKGRTGPTVLTPHPAEMSRLTGLPISEIVSDPVRIAGQFSEAWGVIVVLKGARTVIANGQGGIWISSAGNSGMATAGSGDVLTGIIAALMAQGLDAETAAWVGVHIHGVSGDLMAELKGERGLIAGDLIDGLTDVFKRLI